MLRLQNLPCNFACLVSVVGNIWTTQYQKSIYVIVFSFLENVLFWVLYLGLLPIQANFFTCYVRYFFYLLWPQRTNFWKHNLLKQLLFFFFKRTAIVILCQESLYTQCGLIYRLFSFDSFILVQHYLDSS